MPNTAHALSICWMEGLNIKKRFIVTALLLSTVLCNAQDKPVFTLQGCIDLVLKNNLNALNALTQTEISKAQLQQAGASMFPSVNGYASQGVNTGKSINPYTNTFINQEIGTGQYGVSAGLTLFNGLSNVNAVQQRSNLYQADKMDYEQMKLDLSIQVTQAYFSVLANEELLNQAMVRKELTQAQLDRLFILDKNNAISPALLYDTKGQLANDQLYQVNTKTALLSAKLSLAQLINTTINAEATFEKIQPDDGSSFPLVGFNELYPHLAKNAPALKSADYRKTAALKGLNSARGMILPSLTLNGSLGSNYSSAALTQQLTGINYTAGNSYVSVAGADYAVYDPQYTYNSSKIAFNSQLKNNLNTYIGLSLQVPILNGLKTRTQTRIGKINYLRAREQLKTAELRFRSQMEQTYNEMVSAFERGKIYQNQVNDYSASFTIAKTKFEQGAITSIEYTTAKNNMEKAKAGLITTQYEYLLKKETLRLYQNAN